MQGLCAVRGIGWEIELHMSPKTVIYSVVKTQFLMNIKFRVLRASPPVTLFYKIGLIAWWRRPKIIPPVGPLDISVTLFCTWHARYERKRMKIEWIRNSSMSDFDLFDPLESVVRFTRILCRPTRIKSKWYIVFLVQHSRKYCSEMSFLVKPQINIPIMDIVSDDDDFLHEKVMIRCQESGVRSSLLIAVTMWDDD